MNKYFISFVVVLSLFMTGCNTIHLDNMDSTNNIDLLDKGISENLNNKDLETSTLDKTSGDESYNTENSLLLDENTATYHQYLQKINIGEFSKNDIYDEIEISRIQPEINKLSNYLEPAVNFNDGEIISELQLWTLGVNEEFNIQKKTKLVVYQTLNIDSVNWDYYGADVYNGNVYRWNDIDFETVETKKTKFLDITIQYC